MTDQQAWRIVQLEQEVDALKVKVEALTTLRDQLTGMSQLTRFVVKALFVVGGVTALKIAAGLIHWFNSPMGR